LLSIFGLASTADAIAVFFAFVSIYAVICSVATGFVTHMSGVAVWASTQGITTFA